MSSNPFTTTYQATHLTAVSSFQPEKSWILSSTEKVRRRSPPPQPLKTQEEESKVETSPNAVMAARIENYSHAPVSQHPFYRTTNNNYGHLKPTEHECPKEYHGHEIAFTNEFEGGCYRDFGLNTSLNKSRIGAFQPMGL